MRLTHLSYGSLSSKTAPAPRPRAGPELYQFGLVLRGRQRIEEERRSVLLQAGDMVLYDSSLPFRAFTRGGRAGAETLLLEFPRKLLRLPDAAVARLLATKIDASQGTGRLLARFLASVVDDHPHLTPQESARLGSISIGIIELALGHCADLLTGDGHEQHAMLPVVTDFIRRNLHDPDLTPRVIAAAHAVSLRTLHRLFERHGLTVAAYLKEQRIDRCRRDLADPGLRHLTIQKIAESCGFRTSADFSRSFRAAVGVPPSRFRSQAIG